MATIQRRQMKKGVSYRVMVRKRGYPTEYATFKRLTDAKEWARKREAAMDEGRHFPERQARRRTLEDLVLRYTNRAPRGEGRLGGNKAFLSLVEKEQKKRIAALDWWIEVLGNPTLKQVTPALIADWRDRLAEGQGPTGKAVAEATVNRYLAILSCAFTFAVKEVGWVASNPVRDVARQREPQGRVRFLDEKERERLLAACQEAEDPRLYPLVLLAISTGARQGELLQLRWRDVDLERGVAVLHQTKNRQRRALPVAGLAANVLAERRAEMERVRREATVRAIDSRRLEDEFVFVGRRGQPSFPRLAWDAALRAAQIDDFRFHDLRHTAASYLAMSGATLAEIAEVLGHKTLMMVKRYAHLTEQHTSAVVARMNERFLGES